MTKAAKRAIILTDSSKIEHGEFALMENLRGADVLITDSKLEETGRRNTGCSGAIE